MTEQVGQLAKQFALSRVNYHHLYYFKIIAEHGGIAKAAAALGLGQPTLSTQLKLLEDSLGKSLFERRNRALVLTEAGSLALRYARSIFRLGDEMLDALDDKLATGRITVQLAALESSPKHLVSRLMQAATALGNAHVSLRLGSMDELLRELDGRRVDLILTNVHPPHSKDSGMFVRPVAKVPVVVAGSKNFEGLTKNFPQSLNGQPFILPAQETKLRQDLEHSFAAKQITIDVIAETNDTSLQKLLAIEGQGLIAVPKSAVASLVSAGDLLDLGTIEHVYDEIWLVAASRKAQNPIAQHLLDSFTYK